ncbi:MAG: hypothetical protein EOL87_08475 [Spartobacteria bacterium]|nr:hypothetical protein [Spartobacteria bacterium]
MKISARELILLGLTITVLLLGGTYWWGEPQVKKMQEDRQLLSMLQQTREHAQHLLSRRKSYEDKLNAFRDVLPKHAMDARVTAELLRLLEKTAREQQLVLLKREPEEEKQLGEIYETAVDCTWEGSLEAIVRFMYTMQSQGAVLDVSYITMVPTPNQVDLLKGRFTVDFAYRRVPAEVLKEDTKEEKTSL